MKYYSNSNDIIKSIVRIGDFLLLNLLLFAFYHFSPNIVPDFFHKSIKLIFLIANFAMFVTQIFIQPLIHKRRITFEKVFARVLRLSIVQAAMLFVFIRIVSDAGGFFRFMLYYTPTLFVALLTIRAIEWSVLKSMRHFGINTRSILFVGNDPANLKIYREMSSDPSTGYIIQGYYAKEPMNDAPKELKYLGNMEDLEAKVLHSNYEDRVVDEIFCSLSHDESNKVAALMNYCDKTVTHFYYVPRQFGSFHINLKPEQFGNQIIFTNHQEPLTQRKNRIVKRLFDFIVSLIVCIVILPFIPILALIIKMSSPGPIFFVQKRTGHNGKIFNCYKFRSMHLNKDADMQQASIDDPRKFPFGNFMRKTNIDEFPQFFNVLKGDMSIVGPRPHMLKHTEEYSAIIDKYMVRHFSKPGITGYAQVTGYRGETKEVWQMEERIKRDIWYIENWTFWLDMKIILMTAFSLFVPDKKAY